MTHSVLPLDARDPDVAWLGGETLLVHAGEGITAEGWLISTDAGVSWQALTGAPWVWGGPLSRALIALPDGRALFAQIRGEITIYDAALGTWIDKSDSFLPTLGAAAMLDEASWMTLVAMSEPQEEVGFAQYSPSGQLFGDGDEVEDVWFTRCPPVTGKPENYEARAWGAASGTVVVRTDGLAAYSREHGWTMLPIDPARTTDWGALAGGDGSFYVVGGCGGTDDGAVRRWSG